MDNKKQIIDTLNAYNNSYFNKNMYGIFYKGTLISFGNERLYKSRGIAIKAIVNASFGKVPKDRDKCNEIVEELISEGIIELKLMN